MKHSSWKPFLLSTIALSILFCSCGSKDLSMKAQLSSDVQSAVAKVSEDSIKTYIEDLVSFNTRHTLSSQTDPEKGIGAAVNYLVARCQRWADASSGRPAPVVEVIKYPVGGPGTRYEREAVVPEVMVTIPGTNPDKEIILMAHIDTRVADLKDSVTFAPGANDDGSGLSCLLETVRILSSIPLRQTVKCLFVSGEEQGLDGSSFFAKKAVEENWPILAVINNDMIGNTEASGTGLVNETTVRVFSQSNRGEDSEPRQLARYVKEVGEMYVPDHEVKILYRNDRYGRSGDQASFLREGFNAVRISEYCENYDRTHQLVREEDGIAYGDVITGVNIPYLAKNIRVNLSTVISLASAPAKPEKAKIANAYALSNETILIWEANPEVTNYQVLYRETSDAIWSIYNDAVFVEDGEKVSSTIPLSKDNYIYSVRSLGNDGFFSLPSLFQ